EDRENILMNERLNPVWKGTSATNGNIGKTKNHGYEIELKWDDKIGSDIKYWFKGSYSYNENQIVFRQDARTTLDYQRFEGKPIEHQNRFIVHDYYSSLDDIFNYATPDVGGAPHNKMLPGDFMYIDYNGDGKVSDLDKVPMEYTKIPRTTYSFTLGCSYKGISVSARFYGVTNVSKDVSDVILWDNKFLATTDVNQTWTPENAANGSVVKPVYHADGNIVKYSRQGSTFTYQDGSYLRLKNIEVSYMLSKKELSFLPVNKMEIYANGRNLFTWTQLDERMDPETKNAQVYPMVKQYNVGCRITF
ncbi:MAG: TonB-dependent receptor, partial [Bacteroidales bacterium]|nr:TonB-dependent receptor [Bacteroidales bacterium]